MRSMKEDGMTNIALGKTKLKKNCAKLLKSVTRCVFENV